MPAVTRARTSLAVAILVCLAVTHTAHAAGGICVDDFSPTNNASTVFSDNFDDGDISDWSSKKDAIATSQCSRSPSWSLHPNWHGGSVSEAFHHTSIAQPGVVQASGRASACLDGRQLLNIPYDPQEFASFNNASVWGWLGDGQPVPEPSSLLALGAGVVALRMLVRRRKS